MEEAKTYEAWTHEFRGELPLEESLAKIDAWAEYLTRMASHMRFGKTRQAEFAHAVGLKNAVQYLRGSICIPSFDGEKQAEECADQDCAHHRTAEMPSGLERAIVYAEPMIDCGDGSEPPHDLPVAE